jgi:hypothetical protein
VPVLDGPGRTVGLILGTAIDTDRQEFVTGSLRLDAAFDRTDDLERLVEENIYRLGGSFIFVLDACGACRVYLDANGSKSLVYDPQAGVAAATAALLLDRDDYRARFDADLYRALGVDEDGWFPVGLTAHRGINRLMCNHYLDLSTMTSVRHWPAGQIEETANPDAAIRTVVGETRRTIRTICRTGRATMALTAGNETRLMLGCSRPFLDEVRFMTVNAPGAKLDVTRAGELARRFGLAHRLLDYVEADADKSAAWQMRVGHCVTGSNMKMHPSVEPLNGGIFIGGLGGEIGRGFLWLNSQEGVDIDAAGIVSRLKLPQHPRLVHAVAGWLDPLRHHNSLLLLDLAYMELRMSCWAFAQSYAMPEQVEINPLVSRRIYQAMLSLPPEMRRNNGMIIRCIEATWPELLALPINRYGDWRDGMAKARDAITNPGRAIRKIRQLGKVRLGRLRPARLSSL